MKTNVPLSNRAYNVIKYLITIFLPAVGALYFAMAQIWDFHRITGVNGTINALITFGGLLIGYSTRQYKQAGTPPDAQDHTDGELIAQADPVDGVKYLGLAVNAQSVDEIIAKDTVTFKVVDKTATDPRMPAPQVIPGTSATVNPATNPTTPQD